MKLKLDLTELDEKLSVLSTLDKIRLVRNLTSQIEIDLKTNKSTNKSLRGLWKGIDITEEDIEENRKDMWANFPGENF
jgi:hypothetical protein